MYPAIQITRRSKAFSFCAGWLAFRSACSSLPLVLPRIDVKRDCSLVALGTYLGAPCKESLRRIHESTLTLNAQQGSLKRIVR